MSTILTLLALYCTTMVEICEPEDQPWRTCEVGMRVGTSARFRLGPRSRVHIRPPTGAEIVIDRLGSIGMRYGRTRYDIATGGVEHESTIYSPPRIIRPRPASRPAATQPTPTQK